VKPLLAYKCLHKQIFQLGNYQLIPIRDEDKYLILKWRNEQLYHLRQAAPLSIEAQEAYFKQTVSKLFEQEKPNQILFSYLENGICIGYGGLVHINWIDKHAEISFIINTELEKDFFEFNWVTYLSLIEQVAFKDLNFHKIFTFGFDLRPHLYKAVEKAGFQKEATLKEHYCWEGQFIDAIIHAKFNRYFSIREANEKDLMLYFDWANDQQVRSQSFNSTPIDLHIHTEWFKNRIKDKNSHLFIFENRHNEPIGQVRIEQEPDSKKAVIGVSIDKQYRGQGLAHKILREGLVQFLSTHKDVLIEAYIKQDNQSSIKSFVKAGFIFEKELIYQGIKSLLFIFKTH
jgi:RimJ/RimL family protein N-acetyltransferase